MRLVLALVLCGGCAATPGLDDDLAAALDATPAARPAALVGTWQAQPRSLYKRETSAWSLAADGTAEHVAHDFTGARQDEICSWRLDDERMRLECPTWGTRARVVIDDGELAMAPLSRVAVSDIPDDAERPVAAWRGEIVGHSQDAIDHPDRELFVTEESELRLYASYTLRGSVRQHSGGCTSTIMPFRGRCALEDDATMACSLFGTRRLDPGEPEPEPFRVLRVPFDAQTGEPQLEGVSLSRWHWQRR